MTISVSSPGALACVLATTLFAPAAVARVTNADGPPADLQQQMDAMRRELERVQSDNQTMRSEIDQLRADANDQWLTEERAREIKGLVQEVLADADTRASLLQSGLTAGWDEHFFLSSPDNRFLLVLEGQMQIRYILNHHDNKPPPPFTSPDPNIQDPWRAGFENTRTRFTFRGHVFSDDIEYLMRGDFARAGGQNTLLDAWVRYRFSDKFALRFGQFKLPFNREELVSSEEQLAVERSVANELFAVQRSQGIELQYLDSVNRWDIAFSDTGSSGISGSNGLNTPWSALDTDWTITSRYERLIAGAWEQFSDFTSKPGDEFGMLVGVAGHAQQGESTGVFTFSRDEVRFVAASADLSVEWGGANAFLSGYYGYLDTSGGIFHLVGVVGQAGVYIAPKWEVFGRAEFIWFESDVPTFEDIGILTAGVNYYLDGHDLKWTTDVSVGLNEMDFGPDITGFRRDNPNADPQIVIRTQFQLLF